MNFKAQYLLALGLFLLHAFHVGSEPSDFEKREEQIYARISHLLKTNETFANEYAKWMDAQNEALQPQEFPCKVLPPSPTVPTSVHKLRHADVKAIAAIGDSLTAGRGVRFGALGLLIDFRGRSWSIGGDRDYRHYRSVPNMFREYNKNIYGFSRGTGDKKRHFNAAVSGNTADSTLAQAKWLVDHMKKSKDIDFKKDWKVVTFFIGGNDLCDFCDDPARYSVEAYKRNVMASLDYLHENLPRTFVNLVDILHVEIVKDLSNTLLCSIVHLMVCRCGAFPTKKQEKQLIALREGYHKVLNEIASSGRYDTRDDFTVVMQPFYDETYPPKQKSGKYDMTFFAADCFHYSAIGQQASAKALWNNMVEPVGSKRRDWHISEPLECPTEDHPYLYTNKNSGNATTWRQR